MYCIESSKCDFGSPNELILICVCPDLGTFFQGSAAGRPLSAPSNNALGFEPLEQQRRLPLIIPSLPSRPLPSPGDHAGQASGSFSLANELGFTSQFFPSSPGNLSGRGLNLGPVSSVIPADQAATIGNINNLVTEVTNTLLPPSGCLLRIVETGRNFAFKRGFVQEREKQ